MEGYVESALFLFAPESEKLIKKVTGNPYNSSITPVALQKFLDNPEPYLKEISHVVVAAPLIPFKSVLTLAIEHDFSVGLIPLAGQKNLRNCYGLPKKFSEALAIALQNDAQVMDVILCNKQLLIFKATIGRLPVLDSAAGANSFITVKKGLQSFVGMKLLPFEFHTASKKTIKTAASGCMILQNHERTLASRLISHDSSLTDGMISMVITAPISIADYLNFLFRTLCHKAQRRKLPTATGYIKSSQITIETPSTFDVKIDGQKATTQTPLHCETLPRAIRVNIGSGLRESATETTSIRERVDTKNLPQGREVVKAVKKRIPLFSYASEDRFKDLFLSLRKDAEIHTSYLVLMVLSTMLAAIGLYQSSTAVVIGAMLLAPLMAPIVSLAMGLLRQDTKLATSSIVTISVGVVIALVSAMLISELFPHKPVTMEMQARINPSLLDIGVAIVAGIAGAYTKSNKDILGSLAGVSIAVALVPPLAVAGIGLGMSDFEFFSQAFLLFFTNLVGIILAATLTFRILGFSPAIRNIRGVSLVALLLFIISIPLYFSYQYIVETTILEENWKQERFLIGDKYLIVQQAELLQQKGQDLLFVKVLVREPLTRTDLNQLREKLQSHFIESLHIRVQVLYIP